MLIKWQVCNLQVPYCHGKAIIQPLFLTQGFLKHAAWFLVGLQAKIKLKRIACRFLNMVLTFTSQSNIATFLHDSRCWPFKLFLSAFTHYLQKLTLTRFLLLAAINVSWELRIMNSFITQKGDLFYTLSTEGLLLGAGIFGSCFNYLCGWGIAGSYGVENVTGNKSRKRQWRTDSRRNLGAKYLQIGMHTKSLKSKMKHLKLF